MTNKEIREGVREILARHHDNANRNDSATDEIMQFLQSEPKESEPTACDNFELSKWRVADYYCKNCGKPKPTFSAKEFLESKNVRKLVDTERCAELMEEFKAL